PSRTSSSAEANEDAMTVAASAGSTTNEIRNASIRDQSVDIPIRRSSAARALLGIGAEQVVERRGPFRLLDLVDRLGLAARKHVAIELRAFHQAARHVAERFQPAQPISQGQRHVLGARPLARA